MAIASLPYALSLLGKRDSYLKENVPIDYGTFSLGSEIPYVLEHAPCDVILWREHSETSRPTAQTSTNGI